MPPIDYKALADQVRQSVPTGPAVPATLDYRALADQVRGMAIPTSADAEAPGLLSRAWQAVSTPAAATMEAIGRPLELLMGTAAGTAENLRKGQPLTSSLAAGFERGKAAFFEPEFADSQLREGGAKVIEAAAPEFAKAHPGITAAAGFVGDVALDPTNLVAAGVIRAAGQAGLKAAAATKLGETFPSLRLRALEAAGRTAETAGLAGMSAKEVGATKAAQTRAAEQAVRDTAAKVFKGVTPEEREFLEIAAVYPESPQARAAAADPRFAEILAQRNRVYAENFASEVASGHQPLFRTLEVGKDVEAQLAALNPTLRDLLEKAIKADKPITDFVGGASADQLLSLQEELTKKLWRSDEGLGRYFFADPKSVVIDSKGGVTVAQQAPHYGPIITPAAEGRPRVTSTGGKYTVNAAETKNVTLKEAIENLGAEKDAAALMERRLRNSARAQGDTDLVRTYVTEFGETAPKEGYRKISDNVLNRMPSEITDTIKNSYLPDAVVNDLEKYTLRIVSPDAENGMLGLLKRSQRLWKTMATTLNLPSFNSGNFLGNNAQMYAAGGMSPREVVSGIYNGTRALTNEGKKVTNFFGKLKVGDAVLQTDNDYINIARKAGVIGGQASAFGVEMGAKIPKGIAKIMAVERGPLALLNPDWAVYDKIRALNQTRIEDPAKLALFVHELRQGKSVEQAALTVRKVLFDYDELSAAERQIRDVVPFYTWTRKNIPLQLATLVQHPSRVSHQKQFLDALREWTRLSDQEEPSAGETLPESLRTGEYAPIPRQLLAGEEGSPVRMRVRLPFFDINALNPAKLPQALGERLTPLVRVPVSAYLQQDIATGRPLVSEAGLPFMQKPDLLGRLLPTAIGGAVQTERGLRQPSTTKLLTGAIPVPGGAVLRALFPDEDQEGMASRGADLILRSLSMTPRVLTPEVYQQAHNELKARIRAEQAAAKQAAYYER